MNDVEEITVLRCPACGMLASQFKLVQDTPFRRTWRCWVCDHVCAEMAVLPQGMLDLGLTDHADYDPAVHGT